MASSDIPLSLQALAQPLAALTAALLCAAGSLWLVSRLTASQTPFGFSHVLEDYKLIENYCDGTWRGAGRYLVRLFLLILTLKRRSPLGWLDMIVTLGIASMAFPGTLDLAMALLQELKPILT